MQPISEYREQQRLLTRPYSVQQNFHGSVGKVASRDIIENNVTSIKLLTVLEKQFVWGLLSGYKKGPLRQI